MANVSPQDPGLLGLSEPSQHIKTIHLQTVASFSLQIGSAPLVEELGLDLLIYVESDQVLVFVVFMHEVHRVPVPSPQGVSLSLGGVVTHHLNEFVDTFLEVFHVFGTILYFLKGILCSHV